MSLRIAAVLEVDASQGQAEVKATTGDIQALDSALGAAGKEGSRTEANLTRMATASRRSMGGLTAATAKARSGMRGFSGEGRMAAGSMGNLVAQFNDLGVMMAAGQNPLQLALQQGTQITQVIGPMGAAGAVRSLGAALLATVSPINLVTIGGIAAGAALFQWFTKAGDEAKSFDDRLEELTSATDSYRQMADRAGSSTAELRTEFRGMSGDIRPVLEEMTDAAARQAEQAAAAASEALQVELGIFDDGGGRSGLANFRQLGNLFDMSEWSRQARREMNTVIGALRGIEDATSLEDRISQAQRLRDAFKAAAESSGDINPVEQGALDQINQMLLALVELKAKQEELAATQSDQNSRAPGMGDIDERLRVMAEEHQRRVEAQAQAGELLSSLQHQAEVRREMLLSGEDSLAVARLQATEERRVFERKLDTLNVSDEVKDALRAAHNEWLQLSLIDAASGVSAAADQATRLADEITRALNAAAGLGASAELREQQAAINFEYRADPIARAGALAGAQFDARVELPPVADPKVFLEIERQREEFIASAVATAESQEALAAWRRENQSAGRSAGQSAKALRDLAQGYRDQIAILRETDPIEKEMLRNREALAGATQGQRDAIRDLIAEQQREARAADQAMGTHQFYRDQTFDVLKGLRQGGDAAVEAFGRVANAIEDAAWQAFLLNEGPLAKFLGGGTKGGVVGSLLGSIGLDLPENAEGGMFYSRGDGTADKGLSWLSSGEFIVNAKATAENRALLEAINAGAALPRFARGGMFGGGHATAPSYGGPLVEVHNHSNSQVHHEEAAGPGGTRRSRLVIADAVGDAMTTKGGSAQRVLAGRFGLREQGVLR